MSSNNWHTAGQILDDIAATRWHILKVKCTKSDFGLASVPDPDGGAYSSPQDTLAGFKGPTSKEREGEGKG